MYLVNSQVITTYATATEADSYVEWAEEAGFSISLLIHNPVLLVRMFYQTLLWNAKDMHITMIGGWLGNLDQVLDVPYLAVWAFTLCLIGLALKNSGRADPYDRAAQSLDRIFAVRPARVLPCCPC